MSSDELDALRRAAIEDRADLARLREELAAARGKIATLEILPDRVHLQEMEKELVETRAAHARAEEMMSTALQTRDELEQIRKISEREIAELRAELSQTKQKMAADTEVVVEKMGTDEAKIGRLQRELDVEKARSQMLAARTDKDEKEMVAVRTRALDAEDALVRASTQVVKAEGQVLELERRLTNAAALAKIADEEFATARTQIVGLTARVAAGDAPLKAAEARNGKLAGEIAELGAQLAAERVRSSKLEQRVSGARDVSEVDAAVAEAAKARRTVAEHVDAVREAERRVDEAEKRAIVADTIAKTMANDVAGMLRRVADADLQVRTLTRALDELKAKAIKAQSSGSAIAEVTAQLETVERELVAERSSSLQLIARKSQLERELETAREETVTAVARAAAAENHLNEAEDEIEALQDLVTDLESKIAVTETADGVALAEAHREVGTLRLALAEAQDQTRAIEREIKIDAGVRAFATKAELEIADLQRELRDVRARLTQTMVERDQLASELRDYGTDGETSEHAPVRFDTRGGDDTASLDIGRFEAIIARATELEHEVLRLQRDNERLRDRNFIGNDDTDLKTNR